MDDSKLRAVRNAALEEAALIAEATTFEGTYCTTEDCSAAAVAIRALKDRPGLIPAAVQDMLVEALKDAHPYIDNPHVRIKIGAALKAAGAI